MTNEEKFDAMCDDHALFGIDRKIARIAWDAAILAATPKGCWKNMGMPHDHSLTADGSCFMCGSPSDD